MSGEQAHVCTETTQIAKIQESLYELFENNTTLHASQRELQHNHKAFEKKLDAMLAGLGKMQSLQQESMLADNDNKRRIEQIQATIGDFKAYVEKIHGIQFEKHTDAHQRLDELEKFVTVCNELEMRPRVATLWEDKQKASGIKTWKTEIYAGIIVLVGIVNKLWGMIEIVPKK